MRYAVKVNKEDSMFLQEIAFKFGIYWTDGDTKYSDVADDKYLCCSERKLHYLSFEEDLIDHTKVSVLEFAKILSGPRKHLKLGEYNVTFKPKGDVTVGCKKFTKEEIEKFIKEWNSDL